MNAPANFIGIDLASGKYPFTFAALDANRALIAQGQGHMDDILAYCSGQPTAILAINAPAPLPGTAEAAPAAKIPAIEEVRAAHGYTQSRIVYDPDSAPLRLKRGFALYQRLFHMGYQPFSADEPAHTWLEVDAEACYWAWLGGPALDGRTLEGCQQRQLVLNNEGWPVADPMEFYEEVTRYKLLHGHLPFDMILSLRMLHAMAAAITAWMVVLKPAQSCRMGREGSRQLYFPVPTLPEPPSVQKYDLPTLFPLT
ncbi:MAG: hypothetical protein HGA86_04775 [Anaerolineaceae bacterium]|nr:hypothetical protein [Anaerolineaceae bacterium]